PGDDILGGTQWSERFEAGTGSDMLCGGGGNDVYVLAADGNDFVADFMGDDEVRWTGVSPNQVERIRNDPFFGGNSSDLILRVAGTQTTLTLSQWFQDPLSQIERAVFGDGTILGAAILGTRGTGGGSGNHLPVLSTPIADQSAQEFQPFAFTVPAGTFTDPDAGDTLALSARLVGGDALPEWLSFDAGTGTLTGTPPGG